MRETVFISHANPEDNEFARWLGLQLSLQGYSVWSDVTKLIGGEDFWKDIEGAIRNQTIKFIFVVSNASKDKTGALNELALAEKVERQNELNNFIIPVRVDDVSYGDINVQLIRLNVIDFAGNWASGLATLLKKLEEDSVPRDESRFNASSIRSWWEANQSGQEIIREDKEDLMSNWLPLPELPSLLYLHSIPKKNRKQRFESSEDKPRTPYPAYWIGPTAVSFATAQELGLIGASTLGVQTGEVIDGTVRHPSINPGQLSNALVRVLRVAWNQSISATGLPTYQMANDTLCHYFTTKVVGQGEHVKFNLSGISGRRALIGKFKGNVWHYGVSGDVRIDSLPRVVLYAHVLASSDGLTLWESKPKLQAARQSACKGWWNLEWRDRQLTFLSWLAEKKGGKFVPLDLSPSVTVRVSIDPMVFHSPIGFDESVIKGGFEELDDAPDLDLDNLPSNELEAQ